MDKPLKDWTLGELQTYVNTVSCCACKLGPNGKYKSFCADHFCSCPRYWDITDPPRFTEQEVEDAKTILRMFKNCTIVERNGCDLLLKVSEYHPFATALVPSMFPSVAGTRLRATKRVVSIAERKSCFATSAYALKTTNGAAAIGGKQKPEGFVSEERQR